MAHSGKSSRFVRAALAFGVIAFALPGCDATMTALAGKDAAVAGPPGPPPAPPPQLNTAFVTENNGGGLLNSTFGGSTILPPTLPAKPDPAFEDVPEPAASAGPHKPLAAVPLSSDPAALSALGPAANRVAPGADGRFVLLVLTPAAGDAASLDRLTATARLSAGAAMKALADAGIPADHVEVSLATGLNVGTGEMRLYQR